jgi:hypothetical protein
MAGHSKWSKVKRFKGAIDAKRGKIFSKLSRTGVPFAAVLALAARGSEQVEPVPPTTSATLTEETPPVKAEVPQRILDPILKEAAGLAKVAHEKLVILRAQPVVWNDGSLGCPEPGMMYTQALVNGYWVVISAGGKTYDFRVDAGGRFHLCPEGRGRPPRQSNTR